MTSYDDSRTPERHYGLLIDAVRRCGAKRVLMGGLGNAVIPRALPAVHFTVVEKRRNLSSDLPNVEVVYGDWGRDWPTTEEKFDAIVADIDTEDALLLLWHRTQSYDPLATHLKRGGYIFYVAYPRNDQVLMEVRFGSD